MIAYKYFWSGILNSRDYQWLSVFSIPSTVATHMLTASVATSAACSNLRNAAALATTAASLSAYACVISLRSRCTCIAAVSKNIYHGDVGRTSDDNMDCDAEYCCTLSARRDSSAAMVSARSCACFCTTISSCCTVTSCVSGSSGI